MYNELMLKLSLFWEIAIVIMALVLGALAANSPLVRYDLQLVAAVFIVYVLGKRLFFRQNLFLYLEVLVFVFIVCFTVFSTGGIVSPFFFLFYFLLFALALIVEPAVSLVLTVGLVIWFISTTDYNLQLKQLLPVFSLPFIAPFAKYLGDLQRRYYRQKVLLKQLNKAVAKHEHVQAYEKEQTLMFLTTVLHRHLEDINDRLKNFLGDADLDYLKQKTKELAKVVDGFKEYVEKIN